MEGSSNGSSQRGSSKNINTSQSMRSETKAKFDALLKAALKNTPSQQNSYEFNKSTQNLIASDAELADTEDVIVTAEDALQTNKVMIVDRFLNDTASSKELKESDTQVTQLVSPLHKAAKSSSKKNGTNSYSNSGTYEVTSPEFLKQNNKDHEIYNSDSSGTYIVEKKQKVADIVIHHNAAVGAGDNNFTFEIAEVDKRNSFPSEQQTIPEKPINKEIESKGNDKHYEYEMKPRPRKRTKAPTFSLEKNIEARSNNDLKINSQIAFNDFYTTVLAVIIHKTDRLQLNSLVTHPLVSVHVMNAKTGKYLKKAESKQLDNLGKEKDAQYVSPVLTHICDLRGKR